MWYWGDGYKLFLLGTSFPHYTRVQPCTPSLRRIISSVDLILRACRLQGRVRRSLRAAIGHLWEPLVPSSLRAHSRPSAEPRHDPRQMGRLVSASPFTCETYTLARCLSRRRACLPPLSGARPSAAPITPSTTPSNADNSLCGKCPSTPALALSPSPVFSQHC